MSETTSELPPQINLATLGNGAAVEKFEDELQKLLDNIVDPNTEAKAKRTVTLKVSFKPTEDRDQAVVAIECSSKLAAASPTATSVFVCRHKGGAVAVENDPKQYQMKFDEQSEPTPFDGRK